MGHGAPRAADFVPGLFRFRCTIPPGMKGRIRVVRG
jgi:hypothetical protein